MDAVSDTSSVVVDIEEANEGGGDGVIAVEEPDDNDDDNDDNDDNDDMATDTDEEEEENDDDDDVTDSSSDEEEEEEELEEEDLDIPTPEEVELEYTFPQDFQGWRSWRDFSRTMFGRGPGGEFLGQFFRVIIDSSCTEIADDFFYECNYLIEIVFPEKSCLTEIGERAFADCDNLQRMNALPIGLLRLRPRAFGRCKSLPGELVIPCTVVLVDHYCFFECAAVTSIVFRDNLTPEIDPVELEWCVFAYCRNLQSVRLPHNIVVIPPAAFLGCTVLQNIPLPLSVEEIGNNAFCYCLALQSVDLPQRTSRIGARAYEECPSLAQVTIRTEELLYCGRAVFTECPALSTIQVYPSLWTTLFESMNADPSFLFHFIRKYQSSKWTA